MKKTLSDVELKRKIRQKKIRKRRIRIVLVFLLLIGIAVFYILLKTKLFPVKNITAKGSSLYSAAQIIKASGINNKTPVFSISEKKVKKSVCKKLPYIDNLKIKTGFPDSVIITVEDAVEYYAFKDGDGYSVTSKNLHTLNFYPEKPENTVLVVLDGIKATVGDDVVPGDDAQFELFRTLTALLDENSVKLNSIDVTDSLNISIFVEDRFKVNLGNKENLEGKIKHLAGMIPSIGDRKGSINLSMWSKNDTKGTFIPDNQS